jgi:hypothetical protein
VRKCIPTLILIAVSFFGTGTAGAQGIDFGATEFNTQKLTPRFYVLTGSPGTDPGPATYPKYLAAHSRVVLVASGRPVLPGSVLASRRARLQGSNHSPYNRRHYNADMEFRWPPIPNETLCRN